MPGFSGVVFVVVLGMRKWILLCLVLLAVHGFAQRPKVFSHHMQPERYAVQNRATRAYLYQQIGQYIQLSYDFEYVEPNFYNNNYLFHEPLSWGKRTVRRVEIPDQRFKPSQKEYGYSVPWTEFIRELITIEKKSAWRTKSFINAIPQEEADSLIRHAPIIESSCKLYETWFLDLATNRVQRIVLGLGVLVKDQGQERELFWIGFEGARYRMSSLKMTFNDSAMTYEQFLMGGLYKSEIIQTKSTHCVEYYSNDDFGTEFDVNLELVELERHLAHLKFIDGENLKLKKYGIDGRLKKGAFDGPVSWTGTRGKRLTASYKDGLPHGVVAGRYEDGSNWAEANFEQGIQTGVHKVWYRNGQLKSHYNFKNNFPDSLQRVYHDNGKLSFEYSFKDKEMHGDYVNYNKEGMVLERGPFKNGYINGDWQINFEFNEIICYYLNETDFQWTTNVNLHPEAFQDCTMNVEVYHEYMHTKGCPKGLCIIPRLRGVIH